MKGALTHHQPDGESALFIVYTNKTKLHPWHHESQYEKTGVRFGCQSFSGKRQESAEDDIQMRVSPENILSFLLTARRADHFLFG